jgi:hypothetical protein
VVSGSYGAGHAWFHRMHIWQITAEIAVELPNDRRILGLLKISTIEAANGNSQFQRTR